MRDYSLAVRLSSLALAALFGAAPAAAQQYPSKPINLIVPNAAGGPSDLFARTLGSRLESRLGQPVIVENRTGGGSYNGSAHVARAAPDGYTLLHNAYGGLYSHLFVKGIELNLTKELVPVAPVSDQPYMLYGPVSLPAKDLRELVAYAKENPKKLNFAIFAGSTTGLEMISFLKANGIEMVPIYYSSGAVLQTAMLRDEVHLFNGAPGPKALIDAGKIRAFAVTAAARDPLTPSVPTAREQGFDWVSGVYYAVFAPPKTPPGVINLLNERINAALRDPELIEGFRKAAAPVAPPATPAQMAERFARETAMVEKAVKDNNITPQ
jgi:tripartite-type tricarboxylate transporter receptor subunit TctC